MLAFTPEVKAYIEWFDLTHRLVNEDGWVHSIRIALPAAGGVGDQDARLMEALELLKHVHDELTQEDMERDRRARQLAKWRQTRKTRDR